MRRRLSQAAAPVVAGLLGVFLIRYEGTFLLVHLSQELGISNEASRAYAFWSGFGSTLQQDLTPFFVGVLFYWHHQCHSRGCWRWAKYDVVGTPFKQCAKCHPEVPDGGPTLEHIHEKHHEAKARRAA